jgi:hypothetical protein
MKKMAYSTRIFRLFMLHSIIDNKLDDMGQQLVKAPRTMEAMKQFLDTMKNAQIDVEEIPESPIEYSIGKKKSPVAIHPITQDDYSSFVTNEDQKETTDGSSPLKDDKSPVSELVSSDSRLKPRALYDDSKKLPSKRPLLLTQDIPDSSQFSVIQTKTEIAHKSGIKDPPTTREMHSPSTNVASSEIKQISDKSKKKR